jgi:glycosyltransferase involved in cell wall biosynthesis
MRQPSRVLHAVLPNDIDDPATPSGGNVYDRRVCRGLAASGWSVREHAVRGTWPQPSAEARADLARVLTTVPDQAVVLLDGLIASAVPETLAPQARRLRLVVLVHMPLCDAQEREALHLASAVVTTSRWTGRHLVELHALRPDRVHVAAPGVDPAPIAPGSRAGSRLLCVAALAPAKGQDVLVEALGAIADQSWSCRLIGSLDRDPGYVNRLRHDVQDAGIADRVSFVGPRTGSRLRASYAAADLLVLPSQSETYGMVVTEALARGTPVLATAVGGVSEAVGRAPDGSLPGMLVPPGEAPALARALRSWLLEPELRRRIRRSARGRRSTLRGWDSTSELVSSLLSSVAMSASAAR